MRSLISDYRLLKQESEKFNLNFRALCFTRIISQCPMFFQHYTHWFRMLCNTQIQRLSGLWYSAEYSTFSISDEVDKYRLTVAVYSDPTSDTKMSYY